ncbi:MAG: SDR family oxidoreductase [Candidatus Marsarchaeota archaeon]|nr:SDR family oxidoreductase [Candidatus Marsarchaeota archaeon]
MAWEDLRDKVVIVTGGGKGIGKVYVQELARQGSKVVTADIDYEATKRVAEELNADGAQVLALEVDVSNSESVSRMVESTVKAFGGVDVLINNASLMSALPRGPWHAIPVPLWDSVMAVNVRGPFLCCLAVYPHMKARGKGKIINISSNRVFEGTPNRLHYTTSKAAIIGFTRALARELGDDNICVNAITPGMTASETQVASSNAAYIQAYNEKRCFKRQQVPQDLVGTVLFLASGASDFMTGQTLNVDGGQLMH